jgi:hypothetical protein
MHEIVLKTMFKNVNHPFAEARATGQQESSGLWVIFLRHLLVVPGNLLAMMLFLGIPSFLQQIHPKHIISAGHSSESGKGHRHSSTYNQCKMTRVINSTMTSNPPSYLFRFPRMC